ncbi:MAG: 3-oxoacyl-[acyl-carrier-protein] reductase [Bryobacteraceae bacterium]|nr:3-oxoacyl-[acyl-carrier-protein] reductase [Bryobacteraceae bacterium]
MSERIAFVTGATRGIGRACALSLAAAGHKLVIAARNQEQLEALAGELRATGATVFVQPMDLGSSDSIAEAFTRAQKDFGPVTILVNNAGITKDGLALRMKKDDWDTVIQTNLTGSFLCCQQAMQSMLKARWGRIINIASIVGETGNAGQANYVASKAGLIGLTKTLAQELASRTITVNAVAPGFVETDMTSVLSEELKGKLLGSIPLKRLGRPEDIAAAVRFLASEEASYITGHVLDVNGGMYM